jgi:hypothetical protein
LGSRSRKRARPPQPPARAPRPAARPAAPGPLDEFSAVAAPASAAAEERPAAAATATTTTPATPAERPKRLRGEAANEAIRAQLKPLEPDERPPALLVAVVITLLAGLGNLALFVAGVEVDGKAPPAGGVIGFAGIMLVMSWGMWTKRYWAILGFQTLLGVIIVVFALFLPTASNWEAVGVCVAIVGLGGWLFWKLVRVLSRVQMPERPGA